jgi:hypothetical protein
MYNMFIGTSLPFVRVVPFNFVHSTMYKVLRIIHPHFGEPSRAGLGRHVCLASSGSRW